MMYDMYFYLEFHKVWGGSIDECNHKVDSFFQSHHIHVLEPVTGAAEALRLLRRDFSLHIVTARQHRVESLTRRWVARHYPDIFDELHFGNHYTTEGITRSKPQICREIGALLLVDDSLKYAKQCAAEDIPVVLFGEYPWNRPLPGDENILEKRDPQDGQLFINRVTTWPQAVRQIHSKFPHFVSAESLALAASLSTQPGPQIALPTPKRKFRIGVVQLCSSDDKQSNLQAIERLVSQAADEGGAELVCLPECSVFLGRQREDVLKAAEPIPVISDGAAGIDIKLSPSLVKLRFIAAQHRVWLSVGGFPERHPDPSVNKVFNTHLLIAPNGSITAQYRKIHLFDSPLAGLTESSVTGSILYL